MHLSIRTFPFAAQKVPNAAPEQSHEEIVGPLGAAAVNGGVVGGTSRCWLRHPHHRAYPDRREDAPSFVRGRLSDECMGHSRVSCETPGLVLGAVAVAWGDGCGHGRLDHRGG